MSDQYNDRMNCPCGISSAAIRKRAKSLDWLGARRSALGEFALGILAAFSLGWSRRGAFDELSLCIPAWRGLSSTGQSADKQRRRHHRDKFTQDRSPTECTPDECINIVNDIFLRASKSFGMRHQTTGPSALPGPDRSGHY